MSKHAQLADGTILEFPDDTADAVMDRVVKQHIQASSPTPQTLVKPEDFAKSRQSLSDARPFGQKVADILSNIGEGATYPIRHPLDFATGALQQGANTLKEVALNPTSVTSPGLGLLQSPTVQSNVKSLISPVTVPAQALASKFTSRVPAPSDQQVEDAAKSFGSTAMGTLVGMAGDSVLGKIQESRAATARTVQQGKSVSALSSVIQPGIKDVPGNLAAESVQPHYKQFIQDAGIKPDDILPSKGTPATMIRGGTPEQLAKINDTLKNNYVAGGGVAEDFTPAKSVQMGLADGAVDSAHRPIASAVNAIKDIQADTVKGQIIEGLRKLQGAVADTDPARAKGFQKAIDQIASSDGTVGSIDAVRQDWNQGMSRFYKGTPTRISDAALTQDGVWKDANAVVREKLYPFVESHVQRAPGSPSLVDAGRTEAHAIAARDGVFTGWLKESNLSDAASIEKWNKYVLNGPESLVPTIKAPASSVLSMAKRALEFKNRALPIGEFNDALRQGLGSMRGFKGMNASALDIGKREHPLEPLGRYSTVKSKALPIENRQNPIPLSAPRPAISPDLSNIIRRSPALPNENAPNPIGRSEPVGPPSPLSDIDTGYRSIVDVLKARRKS